MKVAAAIASFLAGACSDPEASDPLTTRDSQSTCSSPPPTVDAITGFDGTYAIDWRCWFRTPIGPGDREPCDPANNPTLNAVSLTVTAMPPTTSELPYAITIGDFVTTARFFLNGPTFPSLTDAFDGHYLRGGAVVPCRLGVMHLYVDWQTVDNAFVDHWIADAVKE